LNPEIPRILIENGCKDNNLARRTFSFFKSNRLIGKYLIQRLEKNKDHHFSSRYGSPFTMYFEYVDLPFFRELRLGNGWTRKSLLALNSHCK